MVFVVNALYLLKKIRMCSDLYPAKCFTGEKEIIERIPRSSNCAPRFVHFFLFMVMGEGDDAGGKVVAKAERKGVSTLGELARPAVPTTVGLTGPPQLPRSVWLATCL
jgi:hypothetical protein